MQNFRNLLVWQKSHDLGLKIYDVTRLFPREEQYRLSNQLCRAMSQNPTNIAKGAGSSSDTDFLKFLQFAREYTSEVDYALLLARDLGCLSTELYGEYSERISEISRMLSGLMAKLRGS